jgi:sugar porter (SP) family MFS transporter
LAEIASARLKGLFGGCNQLFTTIGGFIGYLYGVQNFHIRYWKFALTAAGIVALFEILMLFTYETPRWLFSKHKEFQAIRVLKILRGPNAQVTKEINQIKKALRRKYTILEQLKAFKNRAVFIPFILVLMLMFFQQFSGINAVIFYASDIFKRAQTPLDVNLVSALAIGVVQVIATLVSVLLVDKLGRKVLLTISSAGMGLSSFVLGIYYYILMHHCEGCLGVCHHSHPSLDITSPCNTTNFGYLAVVCVVFFIISFSLAWGPIPWSMMSELMPNHVRTLAGSIATFVNWTFAAIITSCFHSYAKFASEAGAFWSFTVVMVFAIVLVIIFLPETKGHSLEEIQEHFEQGHIFAISCKRKKPSRPRSSVSRYSTTRSVSVADA